MKKTFALLLVLVMMMGSFAACSDSDDPASESEAESVVETSEASVVEESEEEVSVADTDETEEEDDNDEPLQVYVVSLMSGGAAWGQFERGFMAACEEMGWEGHYLSPQNANSTAEMVNLCETAITNGADILIPVITDSDAFADVLIRAKDEGIVLVGATAPDDNVDAYIGTDPINLGNAIAEALVKSMADEEEINVVTMQTDLTSALQINQRDAFEEKLLELRPDANIVSYEECDSNAATAQDKISALYLANPELNAMISLDSYAGLGAAAFVEENGLQDEFYVVGIDDAAEILQCILDGTMTCTIAQMWYNMGYECVFLCEEVRTDGDYEFDNDSGFTALYADDVLAWAEDNDIEL